MLLTLAQMQKRKTHDLVKLTGLTFLRKCSVNSGTWEKMTNNNYELVCPFHSEDGECGFKTTSDDEYLDHTKSHKPNVDKFLEVDKGERLWKIRLEIAKEYAINGSSKAVGFATSVWKAKPKKMDCGSWTGYIQDHGVTDSDNFIGLSAATGGV